MAIVFTNHGASTPGTVVNPDMRFDVPQSSYVNTSWTPPTSGLIIAFVFTEAPSAPNTVTMSGNSLTWTSVSTVTSSNYRLSLFGADAAGSAVGATTVTASASQVQSQCDTSFFSASGVDLTGGVAAAFVQSPTAFSFGATSGAVTLSAASFVDNRPISGWALLTNTNMTHEWTEADEIVGSAMRLETQHNASAFDTSATVTWDGSSQVFFGIAAELKAPGAPSSESIDPMGMSGFFGG